MMAGGWSRLVLALALAAVAVAGPAGAAPAKVGVVALALWSDQAVFRSEATEAARIIAARYRSRPGIVLVNSKAAFAAGPSGMVRALSMAERGLDPERDVLFVVMTSHGSPQGIAEKGGGIEGLLAPSTLGALLGHSRIRRKVLIVSACYSGIFTTLANPDLLVITAADAEHPSFGCTAGAKWTYFGRAFFDQALRQATKSHARLDAVFGDAAARVRARELKDGFEPSNPAMAGGANVLAVLDGESPASAVQGTVNRPVATSR